MDNVQNCDSYIIYHRHKSIDLSDYFPKQRAFHIFQCHRCSPVVKVGGFPSRSETSHYLMKTVLIQVQQSNEAYATKLKGFLVRLIGFLTTSKRQILLKGNSLPVSARCTVEARQFLNKLTAIIFARKGHLTYSFSSN
jgi:hypothetical protein